MEAAKSPSDWLERGKLFSFPGWETTLLATITPDLQPLIIAYCRGPAERGLIKNSPASYKWTSTFGGHGTEPGQLKRPFGIHVEDVTGVVYITDLNNHRVAMFNKNGEFLKCFGCLGGKEACYS